MDEVTKPKWWRRWLRRCAWTFFGMLVLAACVLAGAEFVRVHEVAHARQAGLVAAAIRAASVHPS